MNDLITAATSGLFVEVGKVIEHMKAQASRIADLERQLAEASAPAVEQQPVAMVDEGDDGMFASILPNVTVKVGQKLYAADTDKVREAIESANIYNPYFGSVSGMAWEEGFKSAFRAIDFMAAQAPVREVPETWISVDMRYPELTIRDENKLVVEGRSIPPMTSSENVIVCLDDGNRRIDRAVRLDGSEHTFFQSYGACVKYWQSLPEAPVQPEGAGNA